MINKVHVGVTLLVAVCCLIFTTNTLIAGEALTKEDVSINACQKISSRTAPKSLAAGSGALWEDSLLFAQGNSPCPCFTFEKLMSVKWDRCTMASLGFPRMLRRIVGNPPNHEIWTVNLHKLSASCHCHYTPAGLCTGTGRGKQGSEIYHEGMSNSKWMTCTSIIKEVAEAQALTCE